jgi:plastocyanin
MVKKICFANVNDILIKKQQGHIAGELVQPQYVILYSECFSYSRYSFGIYDYVCTVHPWMTGSVEVT